MRKKTYLLIGSIQIVIIIVYILLFKITIINGQSMSPTLKDGQITLVYKSCDDYEVGEIITVNTNEYGVCVKRILAKGGDVITFHDGKILKNGIELQPYECEPNLEQEYNLEDDQYFIIGDNYKASIDSRNYGPVMKSDIIGKVVLY